MSLDGLHITELAPAYFENSHNASLAVPLNIGLGSPSPLSVTIHANNVSRQYDYRHVDFGVPHRITVNAAQDNGLEVARQDGSVSVAPQPGFGRITSLYVDGIRAEVPCDTGCVINTPSNRPVDIAAENAWGGRARMSVPELAVPEDPPYRMHNALPWVPGCGKGTYTVRDKGVFRTCTVLDSSYNIAAPRTPEKIGSCNALS